MWDWFINFLTMVLEGLHGVSGDWGLAVIILTLIIRLILTPLQTKSVKSTANMQIMQPKIQEIQEKSADKAKEDRAEKLKQDREEQRKQRILEQQEAAKQARHKEAETAAA